MQKHICLISTSPSAILTNYRNDSYRAGFILYTLLKDLLRQHQLEPSVRVSYLDATQLSTKELEASMMHCNVLLVGISVWCGGPSSASRIFFENSQFVPLSGVQCGIWGTSGGNLTGGAAAHHATALSLQALGGSVFTFGQRKVIIATGERDPSSSPEPDGHFSAFDCWYLEGLAKASIVAALAPGDPEKARELWKTLAGHPQYFLKYFPKKEDLERFSKVLEQVNKEEAAEFPRLSKL